MSSTNIDTIAEFYNAALTTKRPFIVCEDDFQLEILRTVTRDAKTSFYDFERQKIYTYSKNLHDFMNDKGFCFIGRANGITKKAMKAFPNNLLIYSMWKGYLDKNHAAFDSYKSEFIENAMKDGSEFLYLHTSGHATAADIKQVCEITKAKAIIPIHSENPEGFLDLETSAKVCILQDGEALDF